MAIILGLDAAWTVRQPTGVALIDTERQAGKCLAVAPSYESFLELHSKKAVVWDGKQTGGELPAEALLAAAEWLAGRAVDIITIDMPVSLESILGRREADQRVSQEFASRWCSAHSPTAERPGPLGARVTQAFASLGYP